MSPNRNYAKIALAGIVLACAGRPVQPTPSVRQSGSDEIRQGALSGVVVDHGTADPLDGVVVAVPTKSSVTGRDGTFELKLAAGIYRAVFWRAGFETIAVENIKVDAGVNTRIRVVLSVGEDDVEMLGDAITPPTLISGPNPPGGLGYGELVVRCTITIQGDVRDCRPKKGQPVIPEVIRALEARKYRPAMRHGRPIEVSYTFRIWYR